MEHGIPRATALTAAGNAARGASAASHERQAGILLVGHGTRSERGMAEFLRLADRVATAAAPPPLEPAFLELCEPTVYDAVGRLVERGVRQIVVAPLLLFAAGHAKSDIPAAVAQALEGCAVRDRVTSAVAPHLGCHPAILEASARRLIEALRGLQEVPAGQTCLVLVGRGSLDESATAEMHEFARLRSANTPVAETHIAFLAMARPAVSDVLGHLAKGKWRRIIVQPHLLFRGELYEGLVAQVAHMARGDAERRWVVTDYLGPSDELVTKAVLARIAAVK